jgi:hypothetical protein
VVTFFLERPARRGKTQSDFFIISGNARGVKAGRSLNGCLIGIGASSKAVAASVGSGRGLAAIGGRVPIEA